MSTQTTHEKAQHTLTPWKVVREGRDIVIEVEETGWVVMRSEMSPLRDEKEEIGAAEFIVQAVNARAELTAQRDALLEALRLASGWVPCQWPFDPNGGERCGGGKHHEICERGKIERAIAQATGQGDGQ